MTVETVLGHGLQRLAYACLSFTKYFQSQHTLLQGHVHSSALAQPSHSMLVRVSATHLPSLGSSAGVPLPHTVPLLIPAAARNLLSAFSITLLQGHVHSSALAQPSHSMLVRVSATHLPSLGSSAGVPLPHTVPLLIPAAARNLLSAFSIYCIVLSVYQSFQLWPHVHRLGPSCSSNLDIAV